MGNYDQVMLEETKQKVRTMLIHNHFGLLKFNLYRCPFLGIAYCFASDKKLLEQIGAFYAKILEEI